ncbi:MAG TPA: transposase [Aquella sp.]|nr:transposase [Aquella sp.]
MKIKNNQINSNDELGTESLVSEARKAYDPEFKQQVLEIWNSGTYATVVECARSYGLKENTLYNWIHKSKTMPSGESSAEVVKLRKELAKAKMELEILKKATIYFAKHVR